jgi:hypothetical protein
VEIPQPNSNSVQITRKEVTEESETLGIFTSPKSLDDGQLSKMMNKANRWTAGMRTAHLSPRDIWHSMQTQVLPSIKYGLIPLMADPQTVERNFRTWQDSPTSWNQQKHNGRLEVASMGVPGPWSS